MGLLHAADASPTGHACNGVALGLPTESGGVYGWDDTAYPNAAVEVVGGELVVTPDPDPV